jgi:hypothetical protein
MNVVVHGNCQAGAIAFLLKPHFAHWQITSLEVHNCDISEAAMLAYRDSIKTADLIFYQPVSNNYRNAKFLDTSFILENARPSTMMICYPSIYYFGYMQGYAVLKDGKGRINAPHDTEVLLPVVAGMLAGHDDEAIVARTLDPDLLSDAAIDAFHRKGIAELARRETEAETPVPVSQYIEANRFERKCLYTFNHPFRPLLADMLNRAFARLCIGVRVRDNAYDPMQFVRMPALPAVARSFRETASETDFHSFGTTMTREQYVRATLAALRDRPVERLAELYAPHAAEWEAMLAT